MYFFSNFFFLNDSKFYDEARNELSLHPLDKEFYHIPINDTTFKLSVFWPSDTKNGINELRFSDSVSLSFKTRLTFVTCFCGDVT